MEYLFDVWASLHIPAQDDLQNSTTLKTLEGKIEELQLENDNLKAEKNSLQEEKERLQKDLDEQTSKSEAANRENEHMQRILEDMPKLYEGIRVTFPGPKYQGRLMTDYPMDERSREYQMPGGTCSVKCKSYIYIF